MGEDDLSSFFEIGFDVSFVLHSFTKLSLFNFISLLDLLLFITGCCFWAGFARYEFVFEVCIEL